MADTDNQLDPFTTITSVEWGGNSVEITAGSGVVGTISSPNPAKVSISLWFCVPGGDTVDDTSYSLIELNDGESFLGFRVHGGVISVIQFTMSAKPAQLDNGFDVTWQGSDAGSYVKTTIPVGAGLALGKWHHLLFALDASTPDVVPDKAVKLGATDFTYDAPIGAQSVSVYIDGHDATPDSVFDPPGFVFGGLGPTYTLGKGKLFVADIYQSGFLPAPSPSFQPDGTLLHVDGDGIPSFQPPPLDFSGTTIGVPASAANLSVPGDTVKLFMSDVYVYFDQYLTVPSPFLNNKRPASYKKVIKSVGQPTFLWRGGAKAFPTNDGSDNTTSVVGILADAKLAKLGSDAVLLKN